MIAATYRRQRLARLHFVHRAVRRLVNVHRDDLRSEPLAPDCPRRERRARSYTAPAAEPEVDRLSCAVNCTVKTDLLATDFPIRLVDSL